MENKREIVGRAFSLSPQVLLLAAKPEVAAMHIARVRETGSRGLCVGANLISGGASL